MRPQGMTIIIPPPSMSVAELATVVVAFTSALGSIAAIAFALKKNTSEIDKQNITSLQTRVQLVENEKEDVKKRLTICEGLHRDNLSKQGEMQGVITTLERVLQDRNPETTKFMEYLTKVAASSEAYMKKSDERDEKILAGLTSISTFMDQLTHKLAEPKAS